MVGVETCDVPELERNEQCLLNGDRSRSRSAVHEELLGRDRQEQVQSRRTDVERFQIRHFL